MLDLGNGRSDKLYVLSVANLQPCTFDSLLLHRLVGTRLETCFHPTVTCLVCFDVGSKANTESFSRCQQRLAMASHFCPVKNQGRFGHFVYAFANIELTQALLARV